MTVADATVRRTGIVLRDALPWHEAVQIVRTAEETGYEAVFVPEIDSREAFSTLTGFALATSHIRFGTGVVTIWSRSPQITAMAAATVSDVSAGRMILGIGAGSPPAAAPERMLAAGPLSRVEAFVSTVRALLDGRSLPGGSDDLFGADGFGLGFEPSGGPPPIWMAALGDRMVELAGRIADGVILNWCTPERVVRAREVLANAAADAGRDPGAVTVAAYVRATLGIEDGLALEGLREMTGRYAAIPHYLRQIEAMGLGGQGARAARAFADGRPADVPEDLVRALTVVGGRDDAIERFDAYHRAGADLVLCYPVAARDPYSSILGTVLAAAPTPAVER